MKDHVNPTETPFKPLTPNKAFLQQTGDAQDMLAEKEKAQEWRNGLPPVADKKTGKKKKQTAQIALF